MAAPTTLIYITAASHFPIKLTATNFPVWRKQLQSTLIGLDLEKFIDGNHKTPSPFLNKEETEPNPAFPLWFRQDQIIISDILGSCSEMIQPVLSSANTSREAWERLTTSYASASRSRIISLKSKLTKNPKGSRSVADYLQEMRSIADDLALAQSPIDEEDLLVHILAQLGDDYNNITAAIKVRETPISYPKLYDKLVDFERHLKETTPVIPALTTVNYTQRQPTKNTNRAYTDTTYNSSRNSRHFSTNQSRNIRQPWSQNSAPTGGNRSSRSNAYCQFCNIPGHETRDCRKLSKFLRDNNIVAPTDTNSTPTIHATTASPSPTPTPTPWLFDSGASHHVTSDHSNLPNFSEYGGPDEIPRP